MCLNISNAVILINSGSSITYMKVDTLNLLRSKEQYCELCKYDNLNIISINGAKLIYLSLCLGNNLLKRARKGEHFVHNLYT